MKTFSTKINMAKFFISLLIASLFLLETVTAETRYRVKSSDNINSIVERFYKNSELSKGQLLVGILAENPRAFKGGNINFLLRGKRLTLPNESDLQQISPESASEILSEHAKYFRFGITGNLPAPTFSELAIEDDQATESAKATKPAVSSNILANQKIQTQKIDQLQQKSDQLKKQLEALINEKSNRDQRLVELEESLKQTLATAKQANPLVDSAKKQALEESNKQLQKKLNAKKSELAENSKSNSALERKVENLREVLDEGKSEKRTIEPSASILSNLVWLISLMLLAGFLFYLFTKKKKLAIQSDDKIEVSKSGYIESPEERTTEPREKTEEEPLETSVKLDVARAYIEAEDTQSALDILSEIMEEGSAEQRKVAHELLEEISPS
jgi:FimV-like protein